MDMVNSKLKILVLDDDPVTLMMMSKMLQKLGFKTVTACDNGTSALNAVDDRDDPPNLILLDLNMPEMDGVEFVRKLVEHEYTGSLILTSGENERVLQMAEKLVQAHKIAVLGRLKKPVFPDELSKLLEKWRPLADGRYIAKSYTADELRTGISNRELVNYYQPKVAVATGALVGVETLARWCHPVDGLVFPDQFIGLAEKNGLIDSLTHVVLTGALKQAKVWQKMGLDLRVAVNVSMENLCSVGFADFVADAALAADVAPKNVVLEITESRLMLDQRAPLEVLTRLRLKRFLLSIDDFGTGHSSMTQLSDIPFDELKIDRSFVHGAWRDETARAIYDASLGVGKRLGMEVVAEGVEDRFDWDLLRSTGCDLAQGYFIGHPMPAAQLPDWLESWNVRRLQLQVST
jgi:EAL domain-containing protein (putative c-di-GMP-specific phosphodiesterase class I)/FixJ family two-component response regulator